MFSHILASVLLAFSLLPQTVEPANSGQGATVTRAEVASALLLARNPNVVVIKNTGQFPDIHHGDWYEPYMLSAERFGIIKSDPVTHDLHPNDSVNRAAFLKMLSFTFNIPTGYPHTFQDVPKDAWFNDYAGIAQKFHLDLLDDATHLGPEKIVTQSQALSAIQVFLRLYNQSQNTVFDEQQLAIDQARNNVVLYNTISTRQTNVVFSNTQPPVVLKSLVPIAPPPSLPQLRTQIITLVNIQRLKAGLKPLTYNTLLETSAQTYADLMLNEGFFGHVSPEGQTLQDRIAATGYYKLSFSPDCNCIKGFTLGENLGRGQKTPDEVMEDWMNSPAHREAILNPDYTDMGVSAGYWVEHFGGVLLPGQKIADQK
jgi:uncharacterized protein YkwD